MEYNDGGGVVMWTAVRMYEWTMKGLSRSCNISRRQCRHAISEYFPNRQLQSVNNLQISVMSENLPAYTIMHD
jgi:hypothetical protein